MDNALIIDGVLAAILLAGALIGAKRGLFKSLMGLIAVVAALVGALLLADLFADPLTELLAPHVEDAVVERFAAALERDAAAQDVPAVGDLFERLERYGVSGDTLQRLWEPIASGISGAAASARETAEDAFRGAVAGSVRSLVRGAVHAALTLVFYVLLLVVLKGLTRALDRVFDLPVLGAVNGVGGAALGLLETAALLCVALHALNSLGVPAIAAHTDEGYLLPLLLKHSLVEWISTLTHQA